MSGYGQARWGQRLITGILLTSRDRPNADYHQRLVELFGDEFDCDADRVRVAVKRQGMFNLIHTMAVVKIDIETWAAALGVGDLLDEVRR